MNKKIKIFGIGAAILLLTLSLSPVLTADTEERVPPELSSQLQDFADEYSEEFDEIKNFLEENVTEEVLIPDEIIEVIELTLPDLEVIVKEYLQNQSQQPEYDGLNAYWKSDEAGQFFAGDDPPNYHYYWGHVFAINKTYSDFFCHLVLDLNWPVERLVAFLWLILPGAIWLLVAGIIKLTWGAFVDWIRNEAQYSEYGIHLDFFKYDIWYPSPFLNEFRKGVQPDEPWNPEDEEFYPETTWTAVIGPF